MPNDPIPTSEVNSRPDQTAPVPIPAGLKSDTEAGWKNLVSPDGTLAMLTPNSSHSGDVPLHRVQEAREAGYHIAVPMAAPNTQTGWVPYHRIGDAVQQGFTHLADSDAMHKLQELFGPGNLKQTQIGRDLIHEISSTITDPKKRADFIVGMVGTGEMGEGFEGLAPERITPEGKVLSIPPERTAGIHDATIKSGGGIPGGIQKGAPEEGIPDYAMFHDPQTGSSHMLPVDKITPEAVKANLEESRAKYAAADARKAKPTSSATVTSGGTGALSSEELARNEVFVKYSKSGQPTYLAKQPDADLKPGEAILAVNKGTRGLRVQNTNGLSDSDALAKFGKHASDNFLPKITK